MQTLTKGPGPGALGQCAVYDAAVMHGFDGMLSNRDAALAVADPPAQGGDEVAYLEAFLDAREGSRTPLGGHGQLLRPHALQRAGPRDQLVELRVELRLLPALRCEVGVVLEVGDE